MLSVCHVVDIDLTPSTELLDELAELVAACPGYGIEADLAYMDVQDLYGLMRFLRRERASFG